VPVVRRVDVDGPLNIRIENESGDRLRPGAEQVPCPDIPAQTHDLTPQISAKHRRRLEEAAHTERRGRPKGGGVHLEKAIEQLGCDPELVPHDDHGALDVGTESGQPDP
jgi:hypothetical protein